MFLSEIDPKQVLCIINDFSSFKPMGLDRISNRILIALLKHIPNKSIIKGIFPECLKTDKFKQLFNKFSKLIEY